MRSAASRVHLLAAVIVLAALAGLFVPAAAQGSSSRAVILSAQGALTPIMADYLERGLALAEDQGAEVVVFQINTPGGSILLMNRMVQAIRASEVPVIVYVAPRNAMAASAGALITMAGRLSVMSPETTIGAASPVGSSGEDLEETMAAKEKETLKATVRTLTAHRGAEATRLAEDMIEDARSVTVEEAIEAGLVDYMAFDVEDVLDQADGRTVETAGGEEVVLDTDDIEIERAGMTFIEQVLQTLVDPNLVFLLLSVGAYAILIELASPGGWVSGFIGVIALFLAIYGLGILPVNWFGILLMILAFVLFILEIKTPGLGALTAAGAVSFIAGALVLFNSVPMPGFAPVSVPLVIGTGVTLALIFLGVVLFAMRAQRLPVQTGREALVGQIGTARTELNPRGTVHAAGEEWGAEVVEGNLPIPEGSRVEVVSVQGLQLNVRAVNSQQAAVSGQEDTAQG